MRIVSDIAGLRRAAAALGPLAFVPTMGNLHAGHLSLVRIARGRARAVAVSIFVNRLQFGPREDFERYPRTLDADLQLLETIGADEVITPAVEDLYPNGYRFRVEPDSADLVLHEVSIIGSRASSQPDARDAIRAVEQGDVVPAVDRTLRLDDAQAGIDAIREGSVVGRVVVDVIGGAT